MNVRNLVSNHQVTRHKAERNEVLKEARRMDPRKEQSGMEAFLGQPVELASLADYQQGSVVSRTIINKKTGTVTFFAFDQDQGLSEHTAPFDALVQILEGEAEVVISRKRLHVKNGEMVIMPANQPHSLRALKKFKMILTMIRS